MGFTRRNSKTKKQGIKINSKNLQIAENICLILPLHKILDSINESNRGESLGTTKKELVQHMKIK